MKKELLMFGSLLCLMSDIGAVRAQTCATPPSCASLGYTMTSSDCSGQPTLSCPFDASAVFCAGTASSGNSSGGSTGGGAGSGLTESCNGDCFVGFLHNSDGGYLKLIQKYEFVDGVSTHNKCRDACWQNGLTYNIYTAQDSLLSTLCTEANKTSGKYYYMHTTGSITREEVINCSTHETTTNSMDFTSLTGCLCARIIG